MRAHAGPERVGRYRLREKLGEGGMGVVYLATDPAGQPVAVKVLRQGALSEATARRRLAREVDTMRRVDSPFVAEVLDADVEGDPPYIVTPYVAGRTLEDVVATDGPLAGAALKNLARGLAAALAAVHSAGVVHRDLKPGNVMLVDGEPVVIDFGIAQAPDSTRLTMTGMFMGTPGYLAPEVIEGQVGGPAADVHSWGATMAYAATGRPPFGTGQFEVIFYRIVHGNPDLEAMPAALLPLVASALAHDPAKRPSAAQLHELARGLDPETLVPGSTVPVGAPAPPSAAAAGAAVGGPLAAGPFGAGLGPKAGTSAAVAANGKPTVNDYAAYAAVGGIAAAAAGPAALAGTLPLANQRRDDYADLLTPVRYGQPNGHQRQGLVGDPTGNGAAVRPAEPTATPARRVPAARPGAGTVTEAPARWPLVMATVILLVAGAVLWPVAGTAAALLVLVALRAADLTTSWLDRRQRAGARAGEVAGALAFFPLALVRSVLRFVALAPLALLCAGAAVILVVLPGGASSLPRAGALAAGALVACYCLGPGSRACRRPLSRLYGSITRSTLAAFAGGLGLAAVAAAAVIAAASMAPGYWPAIHLGNQLQAAGVSSHAALARLPGHISEVSMQVLHWLGHRL